MESVREMVFFSPWRPPKMHDWSSAFFPAKKRWSVRWRVTAYVYVYVTSTYKCMWPPSRLTTMQWTAGPWESMISSWGSWRVPGGWIPPGHPLCPLGTSLLSWLDFRGAPLSHWTESSWNTCLLRQRSWPRSLPSNGSGTNISAAMSSKKLTFILTGCSEYLYISVCIWYEDSFTQMKG